MRRSAIPLVLLSLAVMAGCTTPTARANPDSWKIVHQASLPDVVFTAGFLDETFGVGVGHFEMPVYTTDGGETWTAGENVSQDLEGLDVVDRSLAWASGRNGQVRVSTDGGRTWQAVSDVGDGTTAPYVSFIDAQTGWVGIRNGHEVWSTADGGQTWSALALPEKLTTLAGISLRTATDGYLLDDTATLYVTQDGGQSWSRRTLGLEGRVLTAHELPLSVIRFTGADHGVVVLSLEGGGGEAVVMRTIDGGQSWVQDEAPVPTGTLHLTHDGETLTVVDAPARQILILRRDGS